MQLESWFQPADEKEQRVVLLYGLGGAGKTQIALKFIADSRSRFTDQFRIDASSQETIEAGYKQISKAKGLEHTTEAAQAWLTASDNEWLILFDNADNGDLEKYLPHCQHGNIIITSRNPALGMYTGSSRKAIQILDLSVDDAVSLLLTKAGVGRDNSINQIHAELHCFPLAIVQAGAFIATSPPLNKDIAKYIPLYQGNKAALLSKNPDEDYQWTVYTTWQISFGQLSPLAAQFLQLCSFMHFEGISEDIFERASIYKMKDGPLDPTLEVLKPSFEFLSNFRNTDTTWNTQAFKEMMSDICRQSLMTWKNNAYSIHPLVHQWARTTSTNPAGQMKLMVVLLGMAAACSVELMQKIQLVLHLAQMSADIDLMDTGFGDNFANIFYAGGIFRTAEALQRSVLSRRVSLLGTEHPDTVQAMANLAAIYGGLGWYTEAEKLEEQVLEKRTQLLGAEHPHTVQAMANLAVTYSCLGWYMEAEKLGKKVLEKRTQLLGTEHPDTVQAMANQAATCSHLGQYTEAEKLEEQVQVLEKRTQLLGVEHPHTIQAMANLAVTYSCLGRYTEAEKLSEKVFEKRTQLLGAEHPDTVQALANLASTYHSLGRYTEAEKLEEQVLEQRTQLLGPEHPSTMQAIANLASTYHSLGRYTEAEKLGEKVLEKRTQLFGAEHPDTVQAMATLASTYQSLGRYTEAEMLGEKVLEKRTQLLGAEHPSTMQAMANLASTYQSLGWYTEAENLEEQVKETQTKIRDLQIVGIIG
ncbi:hypothetical protein C8F01DRAFT_988761 [Mycena amicta]|nr:hypothetical protein C8F01DRAFT_988761 [Mycena amicta]